MAATGFTHEQIACCLGTAGIDPKPMRKHFKAELATAAIKANAAVANRAYQMTVADDPPSATYFLEGEYDVTLNWDEDEGPTLRTAPEEQLGLRLEPQKVAVSLFVIECAQKPSPN